MLSADPYYHWPLTNVDIEITFSIKFIEYGASIARVDSKLDLFLELHYPSKRITSFEQFLLTCSCLY